MVIVAGLGFIVVALVALLVVLGGRYLGTWLSHLVPSWSLPGLGSLRGAVVSAIDSVVAWASAAFDSVMSPLAALIYAPVKVLDTIMQWLWGTFAEVYYTLWQVVRLTIPAATAWAASYARGLAAAVLRQTMAWYYNSLSYARGLVAAVLRQMISLYYGSLSYARGLAAAVLRQAMAWYYDSLSYARGLAAAILRQTVAWVVDLTNRIDGVRAWAQAYADGIGAAAIRYTDAQIARAAAWVKAYADGIGAAVIRWADTAATAAIGLVWPGIRDDVDAIAGDLATDLPQIKTLIDAIPRAVPGDLAGTLAATGALDAVLTRYLRDCGIPNCRNLGAFGRDLQALFTLVEDAALLAWITEAVRDPAAAAQDAQDAMAAPARATAAVMRQTVGI